MRAALAAVLVLLALPAAAQAAPQLAPIGTFDQPVHVAAPPGDAARVFVVEKPGRVQVVVNGAKAARPFLDITDRVSDIGERGLLSIAFAPDYATSGRFYVFYTANDGALTVMEGRRSAANPDAGELVRTAFPPIPHPAENHNGGQLAFGPDGALYVSTGDGGGQDDPEGDAQNPASLLGKILRVDVAAGGAPTVWALGLRNPWRFSFDPAGGTIIIGDVGGALEEEVDVAPAGAAGLNYGWAECEGDQPTPCTVPGAVAPALSMAQNDGYSGVIGGFVVRDPGLPTLLGRYVFGDLGKDRLLSAALGTDTAPRTETTLPVSAPAGFGLDACGRLYVASLDGAVSRIQDGAPSPCPPGSTPPPPPAADTTPCRIAVAGHKRAQRILRRGKRLTLRLRANEACTATLRAKRFRTKRVTLRPGVRRTVRLAPTRQGLRKLRRAKAASRRHRVLVTVRIATVDAAANRAVKRIRPRIR